MKSRISVIIPNYNHAPYLEDRIKSVLEQSYTNFELIILDDCSTDTSVSIIDKFRDHPKISQIIINKENSGSTFKQWNKGVDAANGEWIWIAESDDIAEVDFLEKTVQNISKNSVLSYSQSSKMNSQGIITGSWRSQTENLSSVFSRDFSMNGIDFITQFLTNSNVIPNASAVIFKKDAFLQAGKTDEDIRYNSDWLLWLKILLKGDVSFCASTLNHFRYHEKSVIANSKNEHSIPFLKKYDIIMLERFLTQLKKDRETLINKVKLQIAEFSFQEGVFLFNKNFKKEAFKFWKKYYSYSPQKKLSVKRILKVILHK